MTDQLDALAGENALAISAKDHEAHFESSAVAIQGRLVGLLAATAADLPAISTAPGFTYRYNFELGVPERVTGSLGPIFVDRAETVGRYRLDVGTTYMFVDFAHLNGEDLEGVTRRLRHSPVKRPDGTEFGYTKDTIDLRYEQFTLQSHVLSVFATFGLTDRWDVNFLLPLLDTRLRVRAHAHINVTPGEEGFHFFDTNHIDKDLPGIDATKFGLGDVLLRTKYKLTDRSGFNVASALTIRIPTGRKDDFQGLGDTTVEPLLLVSRQIDRHDVHVSFGVEANAVELDRSRGRYGAGVSIGVLDQLALLVDLIGSSGLTDQRLTRLVPVFGDTPEKSGMVNRHRELSQTLRTDIIDLAVGIKANPCGNLVVFLSGIVPLNSDGLRADVIPAGGLEWSF